MYLMELMVIEVVVVVVLVENHIMLEEEVEVLVQLVETKDNSSLEMMSKNQEPKKRSSSWADLIDVVVTY